MRYDYHGFVRRLFYGLTLALVAMVLHLTGALDAHAATTLGALGGVGGVTTGTDDLTEAMKVVTEEALENSTVTDSELLDLFEADMNVQEEQTGGGRYVETAHLFALNAGYGYRTERDYIPVPDGPVIRNGRIYLKKALGSVDMTADTFEKVQKGKEAFTTWADEAMPRLVERMVNEDDRIMVGYGTGVKARIAAIDTATRPGYSIVTLQDGYGVAGYTDAWLAFLEGERVVFGPNVDGTSLRSAGAGQSRQIFDIDDVNDALIFEGALPTNTAANDYIFSGDDSGASVLSSGEPREFMGLHGHVDDGGIISTYYNIARGDYRQWRSVVVDAQTYTSGATGAFDEDLIIHGDQEVSVKGGGKIDVIVAPVSGALSFWRSLRADRAINDPSSFTGGKGKLWMLLGDRRVEVRSVRKLPPQVAFGLTRGTFRRYTLGKFEWDSRTGSLWRQVVDGTGRLDAFWAYGRKFQELFCRAPRKNIRWENLDPNA